MSTRIKITEWYGTELARLLAAKITPVYPAFDDEYFVDAVDKNVAGKTYTQRIEVIADELHNFLPDDYTTAIAVLMQILGPENPNETGMFTSFYWLMPVGKFVEKYGLDEFDLSMQIIGEVTKRNTGEYAVRPFLRKYPAQGLKQMQAWARSENFHLRRLASEGLRPKLPWAPKLEEFIENPQPVFQVLETLKEDPVKFVQKSVANHLTDYLKVNPEPTRALIAIWQGSANPATQWIIKHATRKLA